MLHSPRNPIARSRADQLAASHRLARLAPEDRAERLAVLMALDMQDIAGRRHDACVTEADLARLGWLPADIARLGPTARAHMLAGPAADALRDRAALEAA